MSLGEGRLWHPHPGVSSVSRVSGVSSVHKGKRFSFWFSFIVVFQVFQMAQKPPTLLFREGRGQAIFHGWPGGEPRLFHLKCHKPFTHYLPSISSQRSFFSAKPTFFVRFMPQSKANVFKSKAVCASLNERAVGAVGFFPNYLTLKICIGGEFVLILTEVFYQT